MRERIGDPCPRPLLGKLRSFEKRGGLDEARARIYAGNAARLLKLPRTAAMSEQAY